MTVLRFYRLSLILPVVVPSVLILSLYIAPGLLKSITPSWLSMPLFVLAYSLLYGGVPYAALAAWAAWFFGGKSETQIRRLLLTMPLLMAGVAVACFTALAATSGALNRAKTLLTVGAAASVVLGYTYVVVVFALRRLVHVTEGQAEPGTQVQSLEF